MYWKLYKFRWQVTDATASRLVFKLTALISIAEDPQAG